MTQLTLDQAQKNATLIYNNPNAIFSTNKKGELITISNFLWFGQIVTAICNRLSNGKEYKQTADVIKQTFWLLKQNKDVRFDGPIKRRFRKPDSTHTYPDLEAKVASSNFPKRLAKLWYEIILTGPKGPPDRA